MLSRMKVIIDALWRGIPERPPDSFVLSYEQLKKLAWLSRSHEERDMGIEPNRVTGAIRASVVDRELDRTLNEYWIDLDGSWQRIKRKGEG